MTLRKYGGVACSGLNYAADRGLYLERSSTSGETLRGRVLGTSFDDVRSCDTDTLRVDVVIPTRGEPSLSSCLQAVEKSMRTNHIILVGPRNLQSKFKDRKRILFVPSDSTIVGKNRSLGLEYVTTKYYASIDSDVIVNKEWFDWCIRTITKEKVGACEGFYRDVGKRARILMKDFANGKDWLGLGNTMLRTDIVRKVGMPQRRFMEDYALVCRIRGIGYQWIFNPKITTKHLESELDYLKKRVRWGEIGGQDVLQPKIWSRNVLGLLTKGVKRYGLFDSLFYCIGELLVLYGYLRSELKQKIDKLR
jgi:hypothetical protein